MSNELLVERYGSIATLLINRPEKKNSFSLAMFKRLGEILDSLESDHTVKVLIVKGVDETAFSSGADISEFLENRFSAQIAKEYNDSTLASIEKLYRFPKPTIALIKTLAIGGGLEIANSCDFRFATTGSKLGITAAKMGIVYNLTSTKRLVNLVGPSKAKELLYTAKLISPEEGKEIGLIDYVYSSEEIDSACLAFAEQITSKSSVSNNGIKQVIQSIIDGENQETPAIEQLILDSFSSTDYKEGIQAFLEKRKPNFS